MSVQKSGKVKRVLITVAAVVGGVALAYVALLAVLIYLASNVPPEWKKANAPTWAFLTKSASLEWRVNTRTIIRLQNGMIVSIVRETARADTEEGREQTNDWANMLGSAGPAYGYDSVDAFDCQNGSRMSGTALGVSFVTIDRRGEPIDSNPESHPFESIAPGSELALQREATCWLAQNVSKIGTIKQIPGYYRPPGEHFPLEAILGSAFQPAGAFVEVGEVRSKNGRRIEVDWQPRTRDVQTRVPSGELFSERKAASASEALDFARKDWASEDWPEKNVPIQ